MFYKDKGFYISLLCGVVALVAFALICTMLLGGKDSPETPMAAVESHRPEATATPLAQEASTNKAKSEVKKKKTKSVEKPKPTKKAVRTDAKPVKNALHFDQETGLLWPLQGEILMGYSADKVVYFETLAQYRTNPALIISAKKGQEVKASADGVVNDIFTSEETGRTLTMSIGDNFTVSYGQLQEITVRPGDSVSEGQVLGKIAKPTKYYSLEGTNLYYQVKENKDPVNPLVLLR